MIIRRELLGAAGASAPNDPYFKNVSLLLHGDGTNGGQNNTFIDSSSNNFTITRNGNTTQGSFAPFGNLWSNYFNGTSDCLNAPVNAAFDFGTGDFTIECWFLMTGNINSRQDLTGNYSFFGGKNGWGIALSASSAGDIYFYSGNTTVVNTSGGAFTAGTWNHVAITRSGSTTRIFVNGVQSASATYSTAIDNGNNYTYIGATGAYGNPPTLPQLFFNGYISNYRVVKGTAVYTSGFTPSTTPLTAISGTSILTCQSNRFVDNSSNNFSLTVTSSPSVQRFSPFAPTAAYSTSVIGGSGYFDGSGDYLTAPSTTLSSNFTFEGWMYQTGSDFRPFGIGDHYTGQNGLGIYVSSTFQTTINGTSVDSATGTFSNKWIHFAVVRNGSTVTTYLDGVSVSTLTSSTSITGTIYIGAARYNGVTYATNSGYISNVRLVTSAVYTGNFTPPTAPLTAITNTAVLCNFINGAIFDNAMMNDLETVGNAQISTSTKKYGTGSLYFDGTGDWLVGQRTPDLSFGTGDFTIEGWANVPSIDGTYRCILSIGYPVQIFSVGGTIETFFRDADGSGSYFATPKGPTSSISANTWFHFAVVRNGTTFTTYVNGVAGTAVTGKTNAVFYSSVALYIGEFGPSNIYPFSGYIDDLRITKGVARYTSNFTPPGAAFPNK